MAESELAKESRQIHKHTDRYTDICDHTIAQMFAEFAYVVCVLYLSASHASVHVC